MTKRSIAGLALLGSFSLALVPARAAGVAPVLDASLSVSSTTWLYSQFTDPDVNNRIDAELILSSMGKVAIPILVQALSHGEWSVRDRAETLLGDLGAEAKSAVPSLLGRLWEGGGSDIIETLKRIGIGKESFPLIATALRHEDPTIREEAIGALLAVSDAEDEIDAALILLLKDPSPSVKLRVLGILGGRTLRAPQVAEIANFLQSRDRDLREQAVHALAAQGEKSRPHLPAIGFRVAAEPRFYEREKALSAMCSIDCRAPATAVAAATAAKDQNETVRERSAWVLGRIATPDALSVLNTLLRDQVSGVRAAALEALRTRDGEPFADAIAKLLSDRHSRVSSTAASTLAALGAEGVARLHEGLDSPSTRVQERCAYWLGETGAAAAAAVPKLLALARSSDARVRARAAEALGKVGEKRAVAATLAELAAKDPDWRVRRDSAQALGRILHAGDPSIEALKAASHDEEKSVREFALFALRRVAKRAPLE